MFSAGDEALDVLCAYIFAIKTTEGAAHCIGCFPHVDPRLCPFGAVADAAVGLCLAPGQDPTVPRVNLVPVLRPNDEELEAAGVRPEHYREAGMEFGFRLWYRLLMYPSPQGGLFKEMLYNMEVPHALRSGLFLFLEREEEAYEAGKAADPSQVDAELMDFFHLLLTMRSFASYAYAGRTTLTQAADRASTAATQVLPHLAHTAEAAVEAAATNTMAQLSVVPRLISQQMDAGTVAVKANTVFIAAAVTNHTEAGMATINIHTIQEVASLRAEEARLTAIVVFLAHGKFFPAGGVCLRGPHGDPKCARWWGTAGAACAGPAAAVRPGSTAITRTAKAAANAVPVAMPKDRNNVRQLQVQNKRNGVRLHDDKGQCVPLLPMEKNLSWKEALEE
ncbi:hypothetical protein I4F81_010416 [Pyropia yezoensis]|uniref:Uncharacterized protein n=1 Tax=Pyropia yezoensis TaxID=2788 RepID=A0ACC3CCA7_PYRYE|nr:hypothetical protein I4F81_010416 [Neopyropia yezoensis]